MMTLQDDEKKLNNVITFNGVLYLGLPMYGYGLKFGALFHDAGPVLSLPIEGDPYLNMLLSSYFILGNIRFEL